MKISVIGGLLKKLYRTYNNELILGLQAKGFTDLRPSFIEILIYVCENEGPSIKEIGKACGLKKQTMTSHLNELERRGYVVRISNPKDKREQHIHLSAYGERFKLALFEEIREVERAYSVSVGEIELERIENILTHFHNKVVPGQIGELESKIQLNLTLDF